MAKKQKKPITKDCEIAKKQLTKAIRVSNTLADKVVKAITEKKPDTKINILMKGRNKQYKVVDVLIEKKRKVC